MLRELSSSRTFLVVQYTVPTFTSHCRSYGNRPTNSRTCRVWHLGTSRRTAGYTFWLRDLENFISFIFFRRRWICLTDRNVCGRIIQAWTRTAEKERICNTVAVSAKPLLDVMTFALFSSCENTPNLFELRFFSSYREEEEDDAEIRKFPVVEEVSFCYSM